MSTNDYIFTRASTPSVHHPQLTFSQFLVLATRRYLVAYEPTWSGARFQVF